MENPKGIFTEMARYISILCVCVCVCVCVTNTVSKTVSQGALASADKGHTLAGQVHRQKVASSPLLFSLCSSQAGRGCLNN